MAVAFLHREFTAYALPALAVVHLVEARGRVGVLTRPWAATAAAFLVVSQGVNALKPYADLLGPGSAGVPVSPTTYDSVSLLLARANPSLDALPRRSGALGAEYLPTLVGLDGFRPYLLSIGSDQHVGWRELLPVASVLAVLLLVLLVRDMVQRRSAAEVTFPLFLRLVGLQAGIVYAVSRELSMFTFRYGLLALYLPIGFEAARWPSGSRHTGCGWRVPGTGGPLRSPSSPPSG